MDGEIAFGRQRSQVQLLSLRPTKSSLYSRAWTVSPGYPEPAAGQIPLVSPLVKIDGGASV